MKCDVIQSWDGLEFALLRPSWSGFILIRAGSSEYPEIRPRMVWVRNRLEYIL